jgi:ribonuclease R
MSKSSKRNPERSSSQIEILKGKLDIARSGMGFVIVEGMDKDILVRPNNFDRAFDGDTVRVQISKDAKREKRIEGKVIDVVERKQTDFIGNIQLSKDFAFFIPNTKNPVPDFYISKEKLNGAVDKDRVMVRLLKWEKGTKKPEGEVVAVIKAEDMGDMAMKEILVEAGFPLAFDNAVLEAAHKLSDEITQEELAKRKDFRDVLTFTIDPVDAKDFDDAISVRYLENDLYEIGVHIADVSHFVKPGSILDQSAYERATSVYLPDRVNPMLPERISNELCSLRPNEDKYTFSAVFTINKKSEVKSRWIGRTVIHSDQRFTYEDVQQIIETKEGSHSETILLMNQLAQQFRKERFSHGAINFSSQEVRFKLDEKGKPIGVVVKESKEAHQLIEEFMLLANRNVAEYVGAIKVNNEAIPFPYRIHDTPDEEKMLPFVAFAKKFGYTFDMSDEESIARSFNKMLEAAKGKPEQHVLEQLGIRTMAKAIYTSSNVGHYGLGFEHYCHFTSPIRRYPDVMVHRIVQECIDKNVHPDKKMEEECKHCSDMERKAMECERAGNKFKQVEFMQDYIGEEFDGVISGAASFGFWVETIAHKCEGLVSSRDLVDYDDFRFESADYALVGMRTHKRFRIGDQVRVRVAAANLEKRQIDYTWIPSEEDAMKASVKSQTSKVKGSRSKY